MSGLAGPPLREKSGGVLLLCQVWLVLRSVRSLGECWYCVRSGWSMAQGEVWGSAGTVSGPAGPPLREKSGGVLVLCQVWLVYGSGRSLGKCWYCVRSCWSSAQGEVWGSAGTVSGLAGPPFNEKSGGLLVLCHVWLVYGSGRSLGDCWNCVRSGWAVLTGLFTILK